MEDMERYGDYNEIDTPPSRGRGLLILKITTGLVCFSVALLLIIRIVMANRYPDFASTVLFDDVLSAHYNERAVIFRFLRRISGRNTPMRKRVIFSAIISS